MLRILGLAMAAAACCAAASASAEQYPSRSVRVVVAAPPGGLTDIVARSVAQFLHEKLGQPFVVENIAGASNTLGAVQVSRSAPDGYTLLVNPSLFVITPMLMNTPYDVVKDFTPISNFGTVPIAIGINPAIPAKTLREFIALAKAQPDKFTWGAEGVGSVGHLTMERIQREADFKILLVHYKGTSPALLDLIAGRVSAMVSPVPNLIEQFRGGTVHPVGVATKTRVSALPSVPTLEESGFPDFEINSWYGLWGPAGMPKDVVATLNGVIAEAMKTPRVTDRVAAQGLVPVGSSSADFAAFQNAEIIKFSKMIKEANIKIGN
ncbi:MAG: tripartite tricarboxylate transporter substrate binding protein [Hyphomicrobiales bacterium]|nr:tripartite tricarboxylate transporter substrate binding protein [Alphaproteobacteria bacterium]